MKTLLTETKTIIRAVYILDDAYYILFIEKAILSVKIVL